MAEKFPVLKRRTAGVLAAVCAAVILAVSAYGQTGKRTVSGTVLPAPQNTASVCPADGSVTLSWDGVESASGYEVWDSLDKGTTWNRIQITSGCTASYGMMDSGKTYLFKVRAFAGTLSERQPGCFGSQTAIFPSAGVTGRTVEDAEQNSGTPDASADTSRAVPQNTAQQPSAVPSPAAKQDVKSDTHTSFAVSETHSGTDASLSWEAVPGAAVYKVQLNGGDGVPRTVQTVSGSTLSVSYVRLISGNTYTYRILACGQDGTVLSVSGSVSFCAGQAGTPASGGAASSAAASVSPSVTPSPSPSAVPIMTSEESAWCADILSDVNSMRTDAGLCTLSEDSILTAMAQTRVKDMAENGYFSHYRDGVLQLHVVRGTCGYDPSKSCGENIVRATYQSDVGHRFAKAWRNSPDHYENITDPEWTSEGTAVMKGSDGYWYGVQIFGY